MFGIDFARLLSAAGYVSLFFLWVAVVISSAVGAAYFMWYLWSVSIWLLVAFLILMLFIAFTYVAYNNM